MKTILSCLSITLVTGALLAPAMVSAAGGTAPPATGLYSGRIQPLLAKRCFGCHGAAKTSGLDLRTREGMLHGGSRGPALVPGRADASRLYRHVAGLEKPSMPPGSPLPAQEVDALKAWIDAGAPADTSLPWAFRPVGQPAAPTVRSRWVRNPIDAFVLHELRKNGLDPSPEAPREVLIRRATFDLTGLPPTPEEVAAFLDDRRPDAYERLIDRLLASPRYGERWARPWLDLARYAESEGFKSDEPRPNAWRYRDYVIQSLNADKPYDRFVREQIAGDELWPQDPAALVATGFNRHWADESNARNLRLRRQEILNDVTDTVGAVFLGLTVGCARCHDHKYDPISQADYYRLQAFFAALQPRDDLVLAGPVEKEQYHRRLAEWEAKTRDSRAALAALEDPYRERLYRERFDKFPPDVQEAITAAPRQRTALQWQLALKAAPQLDVSSGEVGKAMKPEERARWEAVTHEIERFRPLKPAPLPIGIGITDVGREAPATHVLAVGVYDAPLAEVSPGFLSILHPGPPSIVPPSSFPSTGRRTALADWIASPANPLTARVMVNRLWQGHFGRGIVATPSDFGASGEPPAHPELLDWLAREFMARGWRLKAMHRLMMTSATYRQSSAYSPNAARVDPDNRLWWRMPRRRLEAEEIRDATLAVGGLLNLRMGGPSVYPELPAGVSAGGWPTTTDPWTAARRSIYVFVKRNLRYPLFEAFDMPDTHESCPRRSVTTTAPQALMLLNSNLAVHQAQQFAARVIRDAHRATSGGRGNRSGDERDAAVIRAYELAFRREPDSQERQLAMAFLERETSIVEERLAQSRPVALPEPMPPGSTPAEGAAMVDFCHVLLNANEFVTID
jgi:hypothetical protein